MQRIVNLTFFCVARGILAGMANHPISVPGFVVQHIIPIKDKHEITSAGFFFILFIFLPLYKDGERKKKPFKIVNKYTQLK